MRPVNRLDEHRLVEMVRTYNESVSSPAQSPEKLYMRKRISVLIQKLKDRLIATGNTVVIQNNRPGSSGRLSLKINGVDYDV